MGDMLSQAEIDALLGGGASEPRDDTPESELSIPDISEYVGLPASYDDALTGEQKDILGEIGNISMGTAATTLFALLSQKVWITTPKVKVIDWITLSNSYDRPCVGIRVDYKEGLQGSNILILKERDVKIIADLMMGGDGLVGETVELTEIDMSAIGEAMNQMVGSSSTSLSSMIKQKIDIDTPQPFLLNFKDDNFIDQLGFSPTDVITCISFKMEIGSLIDSEIMQILPVDFATDMVDMLMSDMMGSKPETTVPSPETLTKTPVQTPVQQVAETPASSQTQTAYPQQQHAYPPQQTYPPQQHAYPPQQTYPPQQHAYPPQQNAYPPQQMYPPQNGYPTQQAYPSPYAAPSQYAPELTPPQTAASSYRPTSPVNAKPAEFQNFDVGEVMRQKENIGIIMDVPLEVTVELGRTKEKIKDILEYTPGTIVQLDRLAGEPIDVLVNGKPVAKGEVVVIDENFAIRITDIISVDKRL